MKRFFGIVFLMSLSLNLFSGEPTSEVEKYIAKWKNVAVDQMIEHGIPASITMAQGILESGYGRSELAVKANNHFGIKCHNWQGATIYKDDDKKDECFRKYDDATASFEDHSAFLIGRSRYAFLFDLDRTDYKGWAKGLKKAGYATNPKYPKRLIDLIKKYDLSKLDKEGDIDFVELKEKDIKTSKNLGSNKGKSEITNKKTEMTPINNHKVYVNDDRTRYVVAKGGDTFYQISKEFGLNLRQLDRWNDFPPTKDILKEGDIVYIMSKRNKSKSNVSRVKLEESEELWILSQRYGIKLKALMQINNIESPDIEMNKGDIVFLK
ncbi:MAG: glucosaminidase domain-containing protein [Brumimicrobium sp.]